MPLAADPVDLAGDEPREVLAVVAAARAASAPVSVTSVGKRSSVLTGSLTTRPRRIRAGQRTIPGTRTPPSSHEPLPPLKGPAEPGPFGGTTGPLSLVKMTSVFWSSPRSLSPFIRSPTVASSCSIVSP